MLSRRWMQLVGWIGPVLALFGALDRSTHEAEAGALQTAAALEPVMPPHLADTREAEFTAAVHEKQAAQIAPPEVSMPIGHRMVAAWPQEDPLHHSWTWRGSPITTILRNGRAPSA
jgi:hypothetical protein